MKLVSKGNGRNFYGYEGDQILEILKVGGNYYRCRYVLGEGLRIQGEPLKNFTLSD